MTQEPSQFPDENIVPPVPSALQKALEACWKYICGPSDCMYETSLKGPSTASASSRYVSKWQSRLLTPSEGRLLSSRNFLSGAL